MLVRISSVLSGLFQSTDVNPYWLCMKIPISLCFVFQLGSYETEHVLTTLQKPFTSRVVDISLYITCISLKTDA